MQAITTFGLDIAKSVFQVHGVDAEGNVILRRQPSGATYWHSSRSCGRAWSALKPALRRIIGRDRWRAHANTDRAPASRRLPQR